MNWFTVVSHHERKKHVFKTDTKNESKRSENKFKVFCFKKNSNFLKSIYKFPPGTALVKPQILNTSKKNMKCRLDNFFTILRIS